MAYKNLLDGAKGLLGECARILSEFQDEYAIIGEWSPYFLNSHPIKHPGTHDVDLLFSNGKKENELNQVIDRFLSEGFVSSAKHHFQLLKILNIDGIDFVYNVDFLHTAGSEEKPEMFVHQLKLPTLLREFEDETYRQMSMVTKNSDVIFEHNLKEIISENFILPSGHEAQLKFPLMNEAGLILTKMDSVTKDKRHRDGFDIYLAITQARNYDELTKWFNLLKMKDPNTFNSLFSIRKAIDANKMVPNILKYMNADALDAQLYKLIIDNINSFLNKIGLPEKAKSYYSKQNK